MLFPFLQKNFPGKHNKGNVRLANHLLCSFNAHCPKFSFIIQSCCIQQNNRSQRKNLHRLSNGICRRTRNIRNEGNRLPRNSIHQTRFPCVSSPEEADMNTFTLRCSLQTHSSSLSKKVCLSLFYGYRYGGQSEPVGSSFLVL